MSGEKRDPLRVATSRLLSTPDEQLPAIVSQLSSTILSCKENFSASDLSHKLRTRLNALLNGRSPQGRYAAVILVKALLDTRDRETLEKSVSWVRGTLAILSRPDPVVTKKLCVLTLTKVFLITQHFPTLIREITTPILGPYISSCLNIIAPKTPITRPGHLKARRDLLYPILQSFIHLLPNHPTVFRTFLGQINTLLVELVVSESEPQSIVTAAQRLWILLHFSAQKQISDQEWTKTTETLIADVHATADLVFRAVIEEWKSTAGVIAQPNVPKSYNVKLGATRESSALRFPEWLGIHGGELRLVRLLQLLQAVIDGKSASVVNLPTGKLVDMCTRLLQVTAPQPSSTKSGLFSENLRLVDQIDRDEKEALWSALPAIHASAISLVSSLLSILGNDALSFAGHLLENLIFTFTRERSQRSTRQESYIAMANLLEIHGPSLTRDIAKSLDPVLKEASQDACPSQIIQAQQGSAKDSSSTLSINADTMLPSKKSSSAETQPMAATELSVAAMDLLKTYLTVTPSRLHTSSTRASLDRIAVFLQDSQLISASILNPPNNPKSGKGKSSILPHLARACPETQQAESLVRPRMPPIFTGGTRATDASSADATPLEDEEDPSDEDVDEDEPEDIAAGSAIGLDNAAVPDPFGLNALRSQSMPDQSELKNTPPDDGASLRKRVASTSGEDLGEKRRKVETIVENAAQADVEKQKDQPVQEERPHPTATVIRDPDSHTQSVVITEATNLPVAEEEFSSDGEFEIPALTMEQDTDEDEAED